MEHWMLPALLCILAATQCRGVQFTEECVYNPCQNGGTCMNVKRPIEGDIIEYEGVYYLHVSSSPMTWAKANDYCKKEGGGLVGFEDKAEEKFGGQKFVGLSNYWVSARYHGASSEWKWYPSNETFSSTTVQGEDGDCMVYMKGLNINTPENAPCNSNYSFICETSAWISQCRCPPHYYGAFCGETDDSSESSATYYKAEQVCEGEYAHRVTCATASGRKIRIEYAAYGAYDNTTCNDGTNFLQPGQTCLALTSLQKIVPPCSGKVFCDLDITNVAFASNPCTPQKHLDLRYQCVIDDPAVYNAPYPQARTTPPTMYCKKRVYVNITYAVTPENTTVYTPCPRGYTGQVTFTCLEGGMWQESGPDDSGCIIISEADRIDEALLAGNVQAVEIAETIETLLTGNNSNSDLQADEVVGYLSSLNDLQRKQLADSNKTTQERIDIAYSFAERTLSIAIILLNSESEDEENPQNSVSVNVTQAMEESAFLVAAELVGDSAKTVSTESIDMTCGSLPGGRQQSLSYPQDKIFDMKDTRAAATMPASAFGSDSSTKNTIALLEYKKIDNIGTKIFQPKTSEELINKSVVNSIVFGASASRGDTPVKTFAAGEKFRFILRHENANLSGSVSCVYWDSTNKTETPSGSWSTKGCIVIDAESNQTHTTCECNHLTNFAILLDVTGVYTEISDAHITALEMLTIIGCSVSIGCLAICIFAFSFFKSLWNTRTTIHRNLCISLLTAQLLFLVGVERTEHDIVCAVIAAILHYSFLCSFAWMALEGIQLYIMLVHVFSTSGKVLPYYLAGYGLPAIVVAVAGGISKGEGYGQEQYCWLSTDRGFIWSFAGPVALIILVNFVFLVVSIRIAYSGRAAVSKDATNSQNIKVWIKGAVTLTFLLGSTWGVGFFFLSGSSIPLAYAFTILNSLQGMFIFIYHCLGNERIKKEMAKFLLRQPCLPACLRVRLEAVARVGSSVYSTTQSSTAGPPKKNDTVALTEKKKDVIHPVVYAQDVDVDDGKPKSWLYNRNGAEEIKVIPATDYPDPDYY